MWRTHWFPALFFLWSAMYAGDPFVGKWRLNVERSDFGGGPKAKSGSAKYKADKNGYLYESETVFGKGEVARLSFPVRFDGVVYPGTLDGHDLVFTAKKIDENSYNVLISDRVNGKATQVFHYTLSSDNKTLTFAWIKGSAEKPVVHWALLYDRE